jgi:hypothetical protein
LPAEIFQRSESCLAKALTLREHPWLRQILFQWSIDRR